MRLDELIQEKKPSVTLKNAKEWIDEVRNILGTWSKPMPKITYHKNPHWVKQLGDCKWIPGLESIIQINPKVQIEMATFKRVIAHELCHDAVNQLILNREYKQKLIIGLEPASKIKEHILMKYSSTDNGHGPEWQQFAEKLNTHYGVGYVSQFSDETFVVKQSKWELDRNRILSKSAIFRQNRKIEKENEKRRQERIDRN